ncbi:hypothetical protein NLI96_g4600 [Meripilus lineatus]|uniref:Transmembrane protein n=1 Tax=Meripilus lineatus TaxID=2056292 RepID=A0AAD5V483_9APHY|nr:hypothetical protein NLI96_g4600 [Physisporinus lineatus]
MSGGTNSTPPHYTRNFGLRGGRTLILALTPILFDIGVLFVTFHKFKFGAQFTGQNWPVHDASVIQIISIVATLLRAVVAYVGAVTISQIWAHSVVDAGERRGTLAELQCLGLFQSTSTTIVTFHHLLRGRLRLVWLLALICSIHVLLYPTAFITLGTPTITTVTDHLTTYQYTDLPFMTNPGYGDRCNGESAVSPCIGNLMAGSAMLDVGTFDPNLKPIPLVTAPDNPLWMALRTGYSTFTTIQVWMNLGPLNNFDMTSGAILLAQNFGTLERLLQDGGMTPAPSRSIFDAAAFSIDVNTTVPFIISRCDLAEQNGPASSNFTIAGSVYSVPTPVPLVNNSSVIAQVTIDGMALLISFKPDGTNSNIHCAINLGLRPGRLSISSTTSIVSAPLENPWDWGDLSKVITKGNLHPIADFASVWLRGMGWGSSAVHNSVSEILTSSQLSVGTGSALNRNVTNKRFAEYYTLAILSGGINIAFPPERLNPSLSAGNTATRSFQETKTQFYLGLITPARIFWILTIIFNILFMFACIVIRLHKPRWLPNWCDPLTLLCTTLRSHTSNEGDDDKTRLAGGSSGNTGSDVNGRKGELDDNNRSPPATLRDLCPHIRPIEPEKLSKKETKKLWTNGISLESSGGSVDQHATFVSCQPQTEVRTGSAT